MKYSVVLTFLGGLFSAAYFGDDLLRKGSALQARNAYSYLDLAEVSVLERRDPFIDENPQFSILHRRTGRHALGRSNSPTTRGMVYSKGPATISNTGADLPWQISVERGGSGYLGGSDPTTTVTTAQTDGSPRAAGSSPPRQFMKADAQGKTAVGIVRPPAGGRGNIRIQQHGHRDRNIPVTGGGSPRHGGNWEVVTSELPSGSKVTATTDHGGFVEAVGSIMNPDDVADPPRT